MQHLQMLVGPADHRHWCGGLIHAAKLTGFLNKMVDRYTSILRNPRQRSYDRARGRASVRLIVYPVMSIPRHTAVSTTADRTVDMSQDIFVWWLLSTDGTGGLTDPQAPDHHVARDAMSSEAHIEVADYVLAYVSKPVRRDLIDKRTGDRRSIWKSSSTWTWKLRAIAKAEIRAAIIDCCRNLRPGREPAGDRPGYGLLGLLAAQRQRPQFSGVRNDVIGLHRFARETWLAHEPQWLAQRSADDSAQEPVLRPLSDVLATDLPLMRRIRVFDQPPRRVADALDLVTATAVIESPPAT
jgi:hypothetical protein